MVNGKLFDPFQISTGVSQGDLRAPYLFVILIDYHVVSATSQYQSGLVTHARQSRKKPELVINDLDFANGICLLESSWTRGNGTD